MFSQKSVRRFVGDSSDSSWAPCQRVDTIKREMFSQKSVRRFVGDSSAFVMGAMFLASALNRGIHGNIKKCLLIPGGNASV